MTTITLNLELSDLLAGVVALKHLPKLHGYVLHEPSNNWQYESLVGRYTTLIRNASHYQLYVQDHNLNGELVARILIPEKKRSHILHAVLTIIDIRINQMECCLSIIPQYNTYCRSTLRPYAKTVVRQVLKALALCHKQRVCHNSIGTNSLTWQWSKERPHVYVTNFSCAAPISECRALDFEYLCKEDLRRVGILLLELVLDEEMFTRYPNGAVPGHDLVKFYVRLRHTPHVADLLEDLLGECMHKVTAKRALKHKFFRKQSFVKM